MSENEEKPFHIKRVSLFFYAIIIVLLLFFAVWGFTRPAFIQSFNLSDKGTIGDAIGGITSPIINLIGAFLVFISFRAQIQANNIQIRQMKDEKSRIQKQQHYDSFANAFKEIRDDTSNLKYTYYDSGYVISGNAGYQDRNESTITYHGTEAMTISLKEIEIKLKAGDFGFLNEACYIIANMNDLLIGICNSGLIDEKEKKELVIKVYRFYFAKYLEYIIELQRVSEELKKTEQYPFTLVNTFMKTLKMALFKVGESQSE